MGGQSTITSISGAIAVTTAFGWAVLDTPGLSTNSTGLASLPPAPFILPPSRQQSPFCAVLALAHQLAPFSINQSHGEEQQKQHQSAGQHSQDQVQGQEPPQPGNEGNNSGNGNGDQNFSTISTAFDGTNASTNSDYAAHEATFIYSTADQTLYYDSKGSGEG